MAIGNRDFDDLSYPKRRPWLLLVLVVLAAALLAARWRSGKGTITTAAERAVAPSAATAPVPSAARVASTARTAASLVGLLKQAEAMAAAGELVEARIRYLQALPGMPMGRERSEAEARLGKINTDLILTPRAMPEKVKYVVARGDFMQKIARKFGSTVELLQVSNEIEDANIVKVGDLLRVLDAKFNIVVSKKRNDLLVLMNGEFFKRYLVGTGRFGKTPTGTFVIAEKEVEPTWWPQGREVPFGHPDNILGTRWMGLKASGDTPAVRGYGIHGTWDESSIGKPESAGCIRMRNAEVEELFIYIPTRAPVQITE